MKYLTLLGSTGSIGKSTLEVVRDFPDRFRIFALAAKSNIELLYEQACEFQPEMIVVYDEEKASQLKKRLPDILILSGDEGLEKASVHPKVEKVLFAMSGTKAFKPCLMAIEEKKEILIANKELLVMAGALVMQKARDNGVKILPVDSEHNALFQCLEGEDPSKVKRLILTASGGPFFRLSEDELNKVTLEDALKHPKWKMGSKITIDSSTLMNKGLEVIEAHHLFGIPPEKIDVVIHPQSIIHSMVEYIDGSIIAQMSEPDMIYPIQYSLCYPERCKTRFESFDFTKNSELTFHKPDSQKFPCLSLAIDSLKRGGSASCFLNAANEVLVDRFQKKEISWREISTKLQLLMSLHQVEDMVDLDQIFTLDKSARKLALHI